MDTPDNPETHLLRELYLLVRDEPINVGTLTQAVQGMLPQLGSRALFPH
ncbi:MAG: hypothetical protein ACHQ4H_04205 [Ktedonobacterales bacterium]